MQNKNYYKVIIPIIIAILGYFGYDVFLKTKPSVSTKPHTAISECNPFVDSNATQFTVPSLDTVITRKNYNYLTSNEQVNIDTAIARMKRLDPSDPTSYAFQARIHNGPIDPLDSSKPFKTCQHGECCFFLAWHRMYIYFFERIMRSKMVSTLPKPALPFWDFQNYNTPGVTGAIPAKFRYPANATNPLFESRNPTLNNYPFGAIINPTFSIGKFYSAINSTSTLLNNNNYFNFQNEIFNAHGNIHAIVGRWSHLVGTSTINDSFALANPKTAANDPLFFLLHANVDRLWEKWRNLNTTNYDPSASCNAFWMNKKFVFYDELGNKIYLKGSDIINSTTSKLKYKYDSVNVISTVSSLVCTKSDTTCPKFGKSKKFVQTTNKGINGFYNKLNAGTFEQSPELKNFVATNPGAAFDFSITNPNADNIFIELEGVNPILYPDGGIEIYISQNNLNPATIVSTNNSFAGTINLFDVNGSMMHKNIQRINITNLIKNQRLRFEDFANLQCVFIARGNIVNGIESPTTAQINIEKFKIVIYKSTQLF